MTEHHPTDAEVADALLGKTGPAEPAFPDLTDPAVRADLVAKIRATEQGGGSLLNEQPVSSHLPYAEEHHGSAIHGSIARLNLVEADLRKILADPQIRGVIRDGIVLAGQEVRRGLSHLLAVSEGHQHRHRV